MAWVTESSDLDISRSHIEYVQPLRAGRWIDPLGNETNYIIDERGDITEMTDALGNEYFSTYDSKGRLTDYVEPPPGGGSPVGDVNHRVRVRQPWATDIDRLSGRRFGRVDLRRSNRSGRIVYRSPWHGDAVSTRRVWQCTDRNDHYWRAGRARGRGTGRHRHDVYLHTGGRGNARRAGRDHDRSPAAQNGI